MSLYANMHVCVDYSEVTRVAVPRRESVSPIYVVLGLLQREISRQSQKQKLMAKAWVCSTPRQKDNVCDTRSAPLAVAIQ